MRIKSEGIVGIESNTGLGSEVDESTIRADAMVVVEAAEGSEKKPDWERWYWRSR